MGVRPIGARFTLQQEFREDFPAHVRCTANRPSFHIKKKKQKNKKKTDDVMCRTANPHL